MYLTVLKKLKKDIFEFNFTNNCNDNFFIKVFLLMLKNYKYYNHIHIILVRLNCCTYE